MAQLILSTIAAGVGFRERGPAVRSGFKCVAHAPAPMRLKVAHQLRLLHRDCCRGRPSDPLPLICLPAHVINNHMNRMHISKAGRFGIIYRFISIVCSAHNWVCNLVQCTQAQYRPEFGSLRQARTQTHKYNPAARTDTYQLHVQVPCKTMWMPASVNNEIERNIQRHYHTRIPTRGSTGQNDRPE